MSLSYFLHLFSPVHLQWFTCDFILFFNMQWLDYSTLWQIDKSMWKRGSGRKVEIDTSHLLEQFAIKELGTFKAPDASSSQNIMLSEKIAHNFSKSLKKIKGDVYSEGRQILSVALLRFRLQPTERGIKSNQTDCTISKKCLFIISTCILYLHSNINILKLKVALCVSVCEQGITC